MKIIRINLYQIDLYERSNSCQMNTTANMKQFWKILTSLLYVLVAVTLVAKAQKNVADFRVELKAESQKKVSDSLDSLRVVKHLDVPILVKHCKYKPK